MTVLVTGAAGFIGFHLSRQLLARGDQVVGVDNLNDYYDVDLKRGRLSRLKEHPGFVFAERDIADRAAMASLFRSHRFSRVAHLAAQAGVRYSIENPQAYIDANLVGFGNILEGCRHSGVEHLTYASSSSVYGANEAQPFSEHHNVDHPIALYAASKKANELMAHAYSSLYRLPTTGLRFFTVYGPWGRPDMAMFLFTRGIIEGQPIQVFNRGHMVRDFTYVDDVIGGVMKILDTPAAPNPDWDGENPDPATSYAPYRIYNIGNNTPVKLIEFIEAIEKATGRKAIKQFMDRQPGDVLSTCADVSALEQDIGFKPTTSVDEGVQKFVDWYREYYRI